MTGNMNGLKETWKQRSDLARVRAEEAIAELEAKGTKINFNSIAKASGVSKSFLYEDSSIRERIEQIRLVEVGMEVNKKIKYDKTPKSKDVIIAAKDSRIAKLEEENRKLKSENERLRGRLYDMK
jgi:hypothetical protein